MSRTRTRWLTAVTAALLLVGLGGPAGAAAVPTAAQQFDWLVGATATLPVPDAELTQHFSATAVQAAGGPDQLNTVLAEVGAISAGPRLQVTPTQVQAVVTGSALPAGTQYLGELTTDATGLITGLTFGPYQPSPQSWSAVDSELSALAPESAFAASEIDPDGTCHLVHGVDPTRQQPLGSSFKLYVLGALGRAIESGKDAWSTDLAIQDRWKSLPSGVLQNDPAGTELTLAQYADYMISISDNTAADHLIHFLGRDAVQDQLTRFGNQDPAADTPLLTTRELFALKSVHYPTVAR
jgi:hypothetical protein